MNRDNISLYAINPLAPRSKPIQSGIKPTCIIRDKKPDIGVIQHRSNPDQAGTASRNNGDVLPGVLAGLALAVHLVVQVRHRLAQRLDAGRGAVLAAGLADVDGRRAREAALDVVVDLGVVLVGGWGGRGGGVYLGGTLC